MKKIPSLFIRDHDGDRKVRDEINPPSSWVVEGEGIATRKYDGMAVLVKDGAAYKRYDAKLGRTPPVDFVPVQSAPDPISGHWPGWVPATGNASRAILESLEWAKTNLFPDGVIPDGTYEAIGPLIGTRHGPNPEKLTKQILVVHGADVLDAPRDFEGLMVFLENLDIEGVVWHHPDGRMAKIKKMDFPYGMDFRSTYGKPTLAT